MPTDRQTMRLGPRSLTVYESTDLVDGTVNLGVHPRLGASPANTTRRRFRILKGEQTPHPTKLEKVVELSYESNRSSQRCAGRAPIHASRQPSLRGRAGSMTAERDPCPNLLDGQDTACNGGKSAGLSQQLPFQSRPPQSVWTGRWIVKVVPSFRPLWTRIVPR